MIATTLLTANQVLASEPTTFYFGTLYPASGTGQGLACEVVAGPSQIYIAKKGTVVLMTIGEVDLEQTGSNGIPKGDVAQGVATLRFASATSGTVTFDSFYGNLGPKPEITFSNYLATYKAGSGTLAVGFAMAFGSDCTVNVKALYHAN
jgi:hypothetical protein